MEDLKKMKREELIELALDKNSTKEKRDEIIHFLIEKNDSWALSELAEYCEDTEIMRYLAGIDNESIRTGLACNEKISEELLVQLSLDARNWVQYYVAQNPKTPTELSLSLYTKLAQCNDVEVRQNMAEDRLPQKIYGLLANDEDEQVRISVAENDRTPKDVLVSMANDKSDDVRYSLLENPHTPNEVKKRLDQDKGVKEVQDKEIENILRIFK